MSRIHVRRKHRLGRERARKTAEKLAKKLAREYKAKYRWVDDDLEFRSSGVNGKLNIRDDEVEIRMELGMMLSPFKSKIEKGLRAELDGILRDAGKTA
jgi:putative polyhydroxyalkanoate system protein